LKFQVRFSNFLDDREPKLPRIGLRSDFPARNFNVKIVSLRKLRPEIMAAPAL
jgi:hypothetical protein